MGMKQSPKGRGLTQSYESLELVAYNDNPKNPAKGKWTIGYGHTRGVQEGMTCTKEQAEAWYDEDIAVAEHDVDLYVTAPLTQNQFDALVDWTFNLGGANLRSSTMLRNINNKDWGKVVSEMLRWDHQDGKVIKGLTIRREQEAKLWKGEL